MADRTLIEWKPEWARGRRPGRGELERHVRRHARLGAQDPPGDQVQRRHRQRVRRDLVPEGRGDPDDVRGVDRARRSSAPACTRTSRRTASAMRPRPTSCRRSRPPRSRASRRRSRPFSTSRAFRSSPSRSTARAAPPSLTLSQKRLLPRRLDRRGARDLARSGLRARGLGRPGRPRLQPPDRGQGRDARARRPVPRRGSSPTTASSATTARSTRATCCAGSSPPPTRS